MTRPSRPHVPSGSESEADVEFIYGYGRTKHILSKRETRHFRDYSETVEYGICGAVGGHPFPDPLRPVCKRCAKTAAQPARTQQPDLSGGAA